ncbi:MAG: hypothetical protein KDB10_12650 [Acidimicrobiales bacterium]|nr:hypothetical protein [Acidimicrobiales bacterium]
MTHPHHRPNAPGRLLMDRRRFLLLSSGTIAGLGLAGCTLDSGSSDSTPTTVAAAAGAAGLIGEEAFQSRVDEYLVHATSGDGVGGTVGAAAHLIRSRRDPDHTWDPAAVTVEAFAEEFEKIDEWLDTRDFDLMYLFWLLELGAGDTDTTRLDPAFLEAVEQRLVDNRYRYDDPLPADRVDNLWFWSENHIIINLALEYLAGTRLADRTFTVSGLTGAAHAERARADLLTWIRERVELGFFEWHSNVYMLKNITPLTMLAELADDPEVVAAATIGLDLCLLDMAAHNHKGGYTAPRGRTYKKDKMSSRDESTWDVAKLLFDDTDADYQDGADGGATYLCVAAYRAPQLVVDIATAAGPSVVRERHGVFFDVHQPLTDDPEAPYGRDFDDVENLPFWWSLGGIGLWPMAEAGVEVADEFRLWETDLFAPVTLIAGLNDNDPDRLRAWIHPRSAVINYGFLSEANTYAYRDDEVSLATVVDHRPGEMRDQAHAWQAAIDEDAIVFTNHPVTEPAESTEWRDDGRPGYWTGEASMPRSAQHRRTAVHLYLPAWDETTDPLVWGVYGYRPYTHAYVPQDHFDEVREDGHWTLAVKGDAYIGLWSWRTPTWRVYDPAVHATRGMVEPFDLVAEGGPDNVWIVEVGTRVEDGDPEAFLAALAGHEPEVERDDDGFTVAWTSPSSGAVEFSSTGPFVVDGDEQPLGDFPRHDSPWGTVEHLATAYRLETDGSAWAVDADGWSRTVS